MKLYQTILATGALIAAVGLSGFEKVPQKTLEGTVKEEFGNESLQLEKPEYGLVIESQGRTYYIKVKDWYLKPVSALAKAIEPGDKVKITYDIQSTKIGKDGIGTTPSTSVSIIEKTKQ